MKVPRALFMALFCLLATTWPLEAKDSAESILARLPQRIAGCDHGKLSDYGDPRLGASLPYQLEGLTITLYVYDLGHETIADGLKDPVIKQAFEMAKHDIQVAVERGSYADLRLISEGRGSYQSKEATLEAKYEMTMNRKQGDGLPVFSQIHVFGAWNQIFKLRITGNRAAQETLAPKAAEFVADLLKAVEFLPPAHP